MVVIKKEIKVIIRKEIIIFIASFLVLFSLSAQSLIIISPPPADGYDNTIGPIHRRIGDMYSRHAAIYKASEINLPAGGTITDVAWYKAGSDSRNEPTDLLIVYLRHTSIDEFPVHPVVWSDFVPATENFNQTGVQFLSTDGYWFNITLDTPFLYNGTDNIMVLVEFHKGGSTSFPSQINWTYETVVSASSSESRTFIPPDIDRHERRPSIRFNLPVLPVELLFFSGQFIRHEVNKLTWKTASETNNEKFQIERMDDRGEFICIGEMKGNGNSNNEILYEFYDDFAPDGIAYYRLKQIDFDGAFEYSQTISVVSALNNNLIVNIYPNPAEDMISVDVDCPLKNAEFFLISTTGVEFELKTNVNAHTQDAFTIDVSGFSPGIYLFVIINNNKEKVFTEKLIIK